MAHRARKSTKAYTAAPGGGRGKQGLCQKWEEAQYPARRAFQGSRRAGPRQQGSHRTRVAGRTAEHTPAGSTRADTHTPSLQLSTLGPPTWVRPALRAAGSNRPFLAAAGQLTEQVRDWSAEPCWGILLPFLPPAVCHLLALQITGGPNSQPPVAFHHSMHV